MKTLLSMLFVLVTFKSYSQSLYSLPEPPKAKYSAEDSIITDQNNKSVSLYGNATLEVGGLTVKADKVFYDEKNHQVLAKGLSSYTFDKKINVAVGSKKQVLKYTVGNDTVFIE